MNELIVMPDGRVITVAGSSVAAVNERFPEGNVVLPSVLNTHPWMLAQARAERKAALVGALDTDRGSHEGGLRQAKLQEWDARATVAWERGEPIDTVKAGKDALRDLPPIIDTDLAGLNHVDEIRRYLPDALA